MIWLDIRVLESILLVPITYNGAIPLQVAAYSRGTIHPTVPHHPSLEGPPRQPRGTLVGGPTQEGELTPGSKQLCIPNS